MDSNFKQCLDLVKDKFSVLTMFAGQVPAGDILCGLYLIEASSQQKQRWFATYLASLDPRKRLSSVVFAQEEDEGSHDLFLFLNADYSDFYLDCSLHSYDITIENHEFIELREGEVVLDVPYHELSSHIEVTCNASITDAPLDTDSDTPLVNTVRIDLQLPLSQQLEQYIECDADTLQTFAVKNIGQCRECSNIIDRAGIRIWTAR